MVTHRSPSAVLCLAAAAVTAASLAACGFERKGGSGRGPVSETRTGESAFAPVQLVVHPLTRVVKDQASGEERIELHLELRDNWEDSVKWLGEVVLELFRDSPPVANAPSGIEQVKRWRVELSDPEANVKAYDRVTRTYRLTLIGLPQEKKPGVWRLQATWALPEGRTLTASQRFE